MSRGFIVTWFQFHVVSVTCSFRVTWLQFHVASVSRGLSVTWFQCHVVSVSRDMSRGMSHGFMYRGVIYRQIVNPPSGSFSSEESCDFYKLVKQN